MSNLLTISYGDTAEGQAVMEAVLRIMADAGAVLEIEAVQLGSEMVKLGFEQGFDEDVLRKIRCSHVLLKAPTLVDVTTPLRAALGEVCTIFEAAESTIEATLEAAIAILKHLGQREIAELIEKQK